MNIHVLLLTSFLLFLGFIFYVYFNVKVTERESERERDLFSTDLFFKWLQQPELGWAEVGQRLEPETLPGIPNRCRGPRF